MKYIHLAGIAVAAVAVATFLLTAPLARAFPSWDIATAASATQQDSTLSRLSVTAADNIPRKANTYPDAVDGFAWADLNTGKVVVATIHPSFRDSSQNPDSWHLHAAQLANGVNGHNFCIASFFPNPTAGVSILGNKLTVNIENSKMPFATSEIDGAVGFVVNGEPGCPEAGGHLAVDVTGAPVGLS